MQIKQIKETCLYVEDLESIESFYLDTLEFPMISKVEGRHTFFRAGSSVLLIFNPKATKEEKELPPHYAFGPQHMAFEIDPDQYSQIKEKLIQKGVVITHIQQWKNDEMESFYFEDPAGNVLEVVPTGMWE